MKMVMQLEQHGSKKIRPRKKNRKKYHGAKSQGSKIWSSGLACHVLINDSNWTFEPFVLDLMRVSLLMILKSFD